MDLRKKLEALNLEFPAKETTVKTEFVPVPSDTTGGPTKRVSIKQQRRELVAKATKTDEKAEIPKPKPTPRQQQARGPKRNSVPTRNAKPGNAAPPQRIAKRYEPASIQDEVVSANFEQVVAFFAGRIKPSERMKQLSSELLEGREDRRYLIRRAKQSFAKCEFKGQPDMLAVSTGVIEDDLSGGYDFYDVRKLHKIEYVTSGEKPITYIFIRHKDGFRRIRKQR